MLHAGQISEWVLCGPQSVVYNNMGKARKFWTELADELFLNLSVFKHKPEFQEVLPHPSPVPVLPQNTYG